MITADRHRFAGVTPTVSLAALVFLAACASGGGGEVEAVSRSSDRLSREEIALVGTVGADQVVRSLRPAWLRPRMRSGFGQPVLPVVFVDGRQYGPVSSLYQISAADVESMEFMSPADATTLYGIGYSGGVISIRTIR